VSGEIIFSAPVPGMVRMMIIESGPGLALASGSGAGRRDPHRRSAVVVTETGLRTETGNRQIRDDIDTYSDDVTITGMCLMGLVLSMCTGASEVRLGEEWVARRGGPWKFMACPHKSARRPRVRQMPRGCEDGRLLTPQGASRKR